MKNNFTNLLGKFKYKIKSIQKSELSTLKNEHNKFIEESCKTYIGFTNFFLIESFQA